MFLVSGPQSEQHSQSESLGWDAASQMDKSLSS